MVENTQTDMSVDTEVKNQSGTQSHQEKVSNESDQNIDNVNQNNNQNEQVTEKSESKPEKMLSQSEVDKIAYGNKMEGYERGKREAIAEVNADKDISASVDPQTEKITVSKQELEQLVTDTATKQAQKQHAERVVDQFVGKLQLGMQKYSDFDTVVGKLNIPNLPPQLIDLVTSLDNTADIVYELGKNPSKFSSVLNLCNTSVALAYDELVRLSDSIKKNKQATEQAHTKPNAPLDQAKPSNIGTDDGNNLSVTDLRKQPWLKT